MKHIIVAMMLITVFLWVEPAHGTTQSVAVTIADFPISINGVQHSNSYLNWISEHNRGTRWHPQYPLLVYQDITYFPMTWNLSNLLNLNTSWKQEDGLEINQGNPNEWKYFQYDSQNEQDHSAQRAVLISFPVTVNGKVINNATEPYPLLLFRDVTYFPLTWRFAVEEFGWRYSYNNELGLHIETNNTFYYFEPVPEEKYPEESDIIWHHVSIKDDLKIWQEFHAPYRIMQYGDMFIDYSGNVTRVGEKGLDCFGVFDSSLEGNFNVEGDWIYTTYINQREEVSTNQIGQLIPVRVNIWTKEIESLL